MQSNSKIDKPSKDLEILYKIINIFEVFYIRNSSSAIS